jgi:hypothetical protein
MPDESSEMPSSRVARWLMLGALVLFAVGLYFRDGLHLPPFGSVQPTPAEAPAPSAPAATPAPH